MKSVIYTLFVLFYRVFGSAWPAAINVWKGVGGVTIVQIFGLIALSSGLELWTDIRTIDTLGSWVLRSIMVGLFFANYVLLVARGGAVRFEQDFAQLPRSRRMKLIAAAAAVLLLVAAGFVLTGIARRNALGIE